MCVCVCVCVNFKKYILLYMLHTYIYWIHTDAMITDA